MSSVSARYLKTKASKEARRPFGTFPRGFPDDGKLSWPLVSAGELVELNYGKGLVGSKRTPGPVPVYGTNGPCGWNSESLVKGPGVILGRKGMGPLGVEWCETDFWVIDTAYFVTPKTGNLDLKFIYYLTKFIGLNHLKDGTSNPSLSRDTFYAQLFPHPPLAAQQAMASVLVSLDDKIELNRRMNETLEGLAQSLFKAWFVDPRRAHPPEGWREIPLPKAIEVNPPRPLRKGEVAPYLDMANMPTRSARAFEVLDREFGSGMRYMDGDTLVARITPCLENGKTCFVDFLGRGKIGWGSTEYIVLRPKPPLPAEFAYFLARSEEFRAFAISNMTGTSGRQRVPADCLNSFIVAVPPADLAGRFGRFAGVVFAQMKARDEESRTLAALRDTLLPKLLSGEMRVPVATAWRDDGGI